MKTDNAKDQAATQLASIRTMLIAANCDYERLETLRDECEESDGATEWDAESSEELTQLTADAGGCEDRDAAIELIKEDPLSVQVRADWYEPGETDNKQTEFMILLCSGGPAVRIRGDLDCYGQPTRAYLQYQDWGTPWTDYFETGAADTLLEYAAYFYFGE